MRQITLLLISIVMTACASTHGLHTNQSEKNHKDYTHHQLIAK